MNYDTQKAIDKVMYDLVKDVNKKLENEMYESEISKYGVYDITEVNVLNHIQLLSTNETLRNKIVKNITKTILEKRKEDLKAQKQKRIKRNKLWRVSKGKIPCLRQCGYYKTMSKEEIKHEGVNFICPDCSKKIEDNTTEMLEIFNNTSVYKIFGIE